MPQAQAQAPTTRVTMKPLTWEQQLHCVRMTGQQMHPPLLQMLLVLLVRLLRLLQVEQAACLPLPQRHGYRHHRYCRCSQPQQTGRIRSHQHRSYVCVAHQMTMQLVEVVEVRRSQSEEEEDHQQAHRR